MAYPNLTMLDSSDATVDSGIETARATNGRLRQRRMFPAAKATFSLKHWVTAAELATLRAHYAVNRDLAFAFTWKGDGVERSCAYAEAPGLERPAEEPGHFLVDVQLMEV